MGQRAQDTSVMMALSELKGIEQERIAEDRRRAADAKRAQEARVAKAREAEEHARRVAEAEARLRVDHDVAAHDADAERRLDSMRRELAAMQQERERLQDRVGVGALEASVSADMSRRGMPRGLGLVFGAAGLVAGGLALLVAMMAQPPVVQTRVIEVPVVAAPSSGPVVAPVVAPIAALPVAEPVVAARPRPHGKIRPITRPVQQAVTSPDPDLLGEDGDPIGGAEETTSSRRRPRSR